MRVRQKKIKVDCPFWKLHQEAGVARICRYLFSLESGRRATMPKGNSFPGAPHIRHVLLGDVRAEGAGVEFRDTSSK